MEEAKNSSSTVTKFTRGENGSTGVFLKIYAALKCNIADITGVVLDGNLTSEEKLQEG